MSCSCCWSLCMSFASVVLFSETSLSTIGCTCSSRQHWMNGTCFSILQRHSTHFFMSKAHTSHAQMWPQGSNRTADLRSLHTRHSSILMRSVTCSLPWNIFILKNLYNKSIRWVLWRKYLHIRHFLQREAHASQAVMWLHGLKRTSLLLSEQTMHSSSTSWLFLLPWPAELWSIELEKLAAESLLVPLLDIVVVVVVAVPAVWLRESQSLWCSLNWLRSSLDRLESVHKSIGVCCFLFCACKSQPFWISMHAKLIDESLPCELFDVSELACHNKQSSL